MTYEEADAVSEKLAAQLEGVRLEVMQGAELVAAAHLMAGPDGLSLDGAARMVISLKRRLAEARQEPLSKTR